MIYVPLDPSKYNTAIVFLNFIANFFVFFAPIFILIVNIIILESSVIFSVKRQNRYIIIYGSLVFFGMLTLLLLQVLFNLPVGLIINEDTGRPEWSLVFFIYVISIISGFAVIPIIRTSLKIYSSLETVALKKKWLYYFIGSLGVFSIAYFVFITNLVANDNDILRTIMTAYGLTVIIWTSLMYYGIGFKLKK